MTPGALVGSQWDFTSPVGTVGQGRPAVPAGRSCELWGRAGDGGGGWGAALCAGAGQAAHPPCPRAHSVPSRGGSPPGAAAASRVHPEPAGLPRSCTSEAVNVCGSVMVRRCAAFPHPRLPSPAAQRKRGGFALSTSNFHRSAFLPRKSSKQRWGGGREGGSGVPGVPILDGIKSNGALWGAPTAHSV